MQKDSWGKFLISGPGLARQEFFLKKNIVGIGQDAGNDLVLSGPGISPFHCRIACDESGCEIFDLGSASGVLVNEKLITHHRLSPGDTIKIGIATLVFLPTEETREDRSSILPQTRSVLEIPQARSVSPSSASYLRFLKEAAGIGNVYIEPGKLLVLGTDRECDVVLPFGKKVFPRHASVEWVSDTRILRKLFEPAIVLVNGRPTAQHQLRDGDTVQIGEIILEYREPAAQQPMTRTRLSSEMISAPSGVAAPPKVPLKGFPTVVLSGRTETIGRDPSNTIVLDHEDVSRRHAQIEYRSGTYYIVDLRSTNGTFLNWRPIRQTALTPGDHIQIGPFDIYFDGQKLEQESHEGDAQLDARNLTRIVPGGTVILNDVSLSIHPRELVAIVGPSGSGKTTLINALVGFRRADQGNVHVNGVDFYSHFDAFRSNLGYVPQDDIIHRELTVYRALYYAARLRMPEDTKPEKIDQRIEQVLNMLELSQHRNTPISRLSGGQRKRVSIGVELLTRPSLFFLDEPTSGLDPALEHDMMGIFRKLADVGHTTILITHATKNLRLCDQVAFLARGGYLAYYGPPEESLTYFNTEDYVDIYLRLEREKSPQGWGEQFKKSTQYRTNVKTRLAPIKDQPVLQAEKEARHPASMRTQARRVSPLRQFAILTARYGEILARDTRNLLILLLQAPLIGALLSLVYGSDVFSHSRGSYGDAKSLIFFLICIAIWFGTSNAAREIAKEIPIFRRERAVNLGITPYIFSKIAILLALSVLQSAILLLITFTKVKIPDADNTLYRNMFLAFLLTQAAGLSMGLMVSSLVNNPDKAASLVPILLIPQIVFSGAVMPLLGTADLVSYLTLSRWGFELLGRITGVDKVPLMIAPVVKKSDEVIFNIIPAGHWAILCAYLAIFILLTCLFQRLKDYSRD